MIRLPSGHVAQDLRIALARRQPLQRGHEGEPDRLRPRGRLQLHRHAQSVCLGTEAPADPLGPPPASHEAMTTGAMIALMTRRLTQITH